MAKRPATAWLLLGLAIASCVARADITCDYEACVGLGEDSRFYPSIQSALEAAAENAQRPWRIYLPPGEYREKLVIDQPSIQLIGAGTEHSKLHFDAYAGQAKPDRADTWTTWESATVIVRAPDFQARDLSIENRFDYLANDARAKDDPARIRHSQAVALMADHGADRMVLERVALHGYQDTLFLLAGRSLIHDSLVTGTVDFIFGAGIALFLDSEIRMRRRPGEHQPLGYLTAASTDIANPHGFVFLNSRVTREQGVPDNSTSLGRPWHPTTQFSDGRYADPDAIGAVLFANTWMDGHIGEQGWHSMSGWAKDGTRIAFQPGDARFYEFSSTGPGAHSSDARRTLTNKDLDQHIAQQVLGDWTPGIPLPPLTEAGAYLPERELAKHRKQWPQLRLADTLKGAAVATHTVDYWGSEGLTLSADLYLPDGVPAQNRPALILVHGGGWRSGSREFLAPMALRLAAQGVVVMTVDYRLSREALFPAAVFDVKRAISWLRMQAHRYGVDPNRIAVLGTSAGAQLASLVATSSQVPALTPPEQQPGEAAAWALVNMDGVVDMMSEHTRQFEDRPDKASAFGLWVGGRYADRPQQWALASPLSHLDDHTPPTLFINSAQPRFHSGRDAFVAELSRRQIDSAVITIDDTPHTFWLFDLWLDQAVSHITHFLQRVKQADKG